MEPQEHLLQVSRTARYHTLGTPGPATRRIWFVCHGFGQLSYFSARHFIPFAEAGDYVVAAEGLSRFYLDGYERVGASWATKELKEEDVADNIAWLEQCYRAALAAAPADAQVVLFGFSQGVSAAWRLAARTSVALHHLVCWAGSPVLEEMAPVLQRTQAGMGLHLVWGDADPLVTPTRMAKLKSALQQAGFTPAEHPFVGGHHIVPEVLQQIAQQL